jgi:hypothetical protein
MWWRILTASWVEDERLPPRRPSLSFQRPLRQFACSDVLEPCLYIALVLVLVLDLCGFGFGFGFERRVFFDEKR